MANHERDAEREAFWRGVLKRYATSGLTIRAFCRREHLTESAFFAWRRTIAERDAEAKPQASRGGRLKRPAFLPVVVDDDHRRNGHLVIELAGDRVLKLPASTSAAWLVELLLGLESGAQS